MAPFVLLLLILLSACNPVKEPPIVPLSPCTPCVKPSPPPKDPCSLIYPVDGRGVTLCELIDIALHNHPLTKESWAQAKAASAGVTIAESSFYPHLMLDLEANKARLSAANISVTGSGLGTFTSYDAMLSLSYLLWDFGGGRAYTLMSAKEMLCAASWNYSWVIQGTMINVISSYWQTIGAKASVEAAEADLKDAFTLLEVSETKKKAGLATHVDVARAMANYVKAQLNLVSAQGTYKNNQSALATNIGLEPDIEFILERPRAIAPSRLTEDLDRLLARAKCCRADLTAMKIALKAQSYAVEAAKSQLYPSLNASGWAAKVWYQGIGGIHGLNYSGALNLNYPFFSGFETLGTIKQDEAKLAEDLAAYKNQENNALLNVANNYTSVKTSIESVAFSKKYLAYAQDSFASSLKGYKTGTRSIEDVVSAEATLSDARSSLVESETQYYVSLANLAYTTGLLVSKEVAN